MPKKVIPTLTGRTVRAILFDLGSTLWIFKDNASRLALEHLAQQRALAVLRKHIPPQYFPDIDATTLGEQLYKAIGQHIFSTQPGSDHEPDFALATVEALQQVGFPKVERAVGAEVFEAQRIRIPESRLLFEDALTTLATLQKRGFLLGVVTNRSYGGALFIEDLHTLGLLDYFDPRQVAISADLGIRKPNPKIFQYTLDALHVVSKEAVMVGDSLRADIAGAKKIKMFAIWKPPPRVFAQVKAAYEQQHAGDALNDALFTYARQYEEARGRHILEDLKPDLIIEHLSELLDIFVEVGKQ